MPSSINGIGTFWYGHALEEPDGSYVVTEWVTFVWVPLIPLWSKRVQPALPPDAPWWKKEIATTHYRAMKVPLHLPHVLKGYAATFAVVALIAAANYFKW
jgi:hypothetical protein